MRHDDVLQRRVERRKLVGLLARTLGLEKSEEVVLAAARKLHIALGEDLTVAQALAILDDLAETPAIVGVVARVVKARGELQELAEPSQPPPSHPSSAPPSSRPSGAPSGAVPVRLTRDDLMALLAPALGEARSAEAIAAFAPKAGATGPDFSRAQAAKMLELMSAAEGMLGVVASFARARFLLKFPG
jgi:hypothetical protein